MNGGHGQPFLTKPFKMELNRLVNKASYLFTSCRRCDASGEIRDVGPEACFLFFDYNEILHAFCVSARLFT